MVTLADRVKVTTSSTGTGSVSLGSAQSGYQTFADAGISDGDTVRYTIEDGSAWEIGTGTYTHFNTIMSRTLIDSSTGSLLNLSGSATVFLTVASSDLQELLDFATEFTLPTTDGSAQQILQTDGNGALTFTTPSSGGFEPINIADNEIQQSQTVSASQNAISVGPVSLATGVTITVASGARYVVL